jgi:hypothetical protein
MVALTEQYLASPLARQIRDTPKSLLTKCLCTSPNEPTTVQEQQSYSCNVDMR